MEKMIWIKNIDEYLRKKGQKKNSILRIGFKFKKKIFSKLYAKNTSEHYIVKDVVNFGEDAQVFWDKIRDNFDLIIERNPEYLNHRYCDPRAGKYTVKGVYRGDEMLGYGVTVVRENGKICERKILDFLSLPGEQDAADILLKHILNDKIDEIDSVEAWIVKNSYTYQTFRKNSFVTYNDKDLYLYLNSVSRENEEWNHLHDSHPDKIHFVMGDTDLM